MSDGDRRREMVRGDGVNEKNLFLDRVMFGKEKVFFFFSPQWTNNPRDGPTGLWVMTGA